MANGLLDPAGGCLGSIETGTPVEVMFADVWLSGDQHGGPYPGPPADDAGEPLQLAERPTASELGVTTPSATLPRRQRAW